MQQLKVEPKHPLSETVPDLRALWRPYLMFLRCIGVVNCRSDWSSNSWRDPWTLVCLANLLNTWAIFLIRMEIMKLTQASSKVELANSIICVIAVCAEVISFTTLFVSSVCGNAFQDVFLMWSQLQLKPSSLKRLGSRVKMASWCLLVIFLILSVIQITAYLLILYTKNMLTGCLTVRLFSAYVRIISLFTSVHMVGFIALMSITLWLLFAEVNSTIEARDVVGLHANIKAFSTIFRQAAEIVSAFDSFLAFIIGPYFLSYICQMVFNTYLVFEEQSLGYDSPNKYWMVESVVILLLVFLLPAMVNVQAHRSYKVLCCSATEDLPVPLLLLVNGLQNRLSTSPIGLSAFHIRVVAISLIPSMISIYFTYIFLIIQFRTSGVQCDNSSI